MPKPAQIADSRLTWSRLRTIGKSQAAKVTVLLPLVGYLIIFNKKIADFLQLATQFAGSDSAPLSVSSKLMLVYVGTCFVAAGQVIYGIFCPAEVKAYGHVTPYILDAANVTKDFEFENIENELKKSGYSEQLKWIRGRYESLYEDQPTTEEKAVVNNSVLHLHFQFLNNKTPVARWSSGVCYFVGLLCLIIPSSGVFRRVIEIIFEVAMKDIQSFF